MNLRHREIASLLAALVVAGVTPGCRSATVRAADGDIPTAAVQQGDLQIKVFATGELRSTHSSTLSAPAIAGGTLQIVRLARTGTPVRASEIVIEFDPSQQQYSQGQAHSDLQQAEQEIVKAKADAAVQTAEDQTALLKAKYAVRQAELEVSKNELLSQIDAQKNLLALEEAKRALTQLEQDIKSHTASNEAALALSKEKLNKARLAMQQAERNIQNMTVKSPIDGLVVVRGNPNSTGGMFWGGMTLPDFQVGDQANPGNIVAEVVDIGQIEIAAQIGETDRANLKGGQKAEVQVEALPGHTFSGTIATVAAMSNHQFWDDNAQRKFDVSLHLDQPDPRLRPGFSAKLTAFGEKFPGSLSIPREAVFEQDGKMRVYVEHNGGFEPREVKVRAFSDGRAIVDGMPAGTRVALVNPESRGATKKKESSAPNPTLASKTQ